MRIYQNTKKNCTLWPGLCPEFNRVYKPENIDINILPLDYFIELLQVISYFDRLIPLEIAKYTKGERLRLFKLNRNDERR